MGIQSSVNALMQQLYTIGAIGAGLREQKKQTKAAVASAPSFEERFRKRYNIDDKTPLTFDQKMAVKYGEHREARLGRIVEPGEAVRWVRVQKLNGERMNSFIDSQREIPKVKNEVASDLARASVEARTDSINQAKSAFNAHTASLIKKYGKGSGNP